MSATDLDSAKKEVTWSEVADGYRKAAQAYRDAADIAEVGAWTIGILLALWVVSGIVVRFL